MSRKIAYRFFYIVLAASVVPGLGYSQLEADHWMVSHNYYVYFNRATTPDQIPYPNNNASILFGPGSASYSDRNGNLLFYGSGGQLYDRDFNGFPSLDIFTGTPLYGADNSSSATQPLLGIPYPGRDSLYIMFHIRSEFNNQHRSPLYYSVVNMRLRDGLGEIVPSQKNIPLFNSIDVGFKLTAISHCNKRDIWVIGHFLDSDQYFSLLVTDNGISNTPTYFPGNFIPRVVSTASWHPNNLGCAKVSASGNRFAAAFKGLNFVELFDFNTQTGIASNLKTITAHPPPQDTVYYPWHYANYGPVGIDFSPSGDKLYVTSNYDLRNFSSQDFGGYIYQFDASLPTATQVQNSQFQLDLLEGYYAAAIQIGNNGKMYVNVDNSLCEIANPENTGTACGYTRFAVFSGQQFSVGNLPSFLQNYFRYPVITTGNCQFQNISFSVQNLSGVNAVLWDFGDPSAGVNNTSTSFTPTHIYSQQGSYLTKVILYNSNGCGADTIRKIVHAGPFQVYLGNDTTICQGDTLKLRMNIPGAAILWSNNSRDTIVNIMQSGTYWVRANIGECVASDTISITVRPLPSFTLGNDQVICSNQALTLIPTPDPPNVLYSWSNGAITPSISPNMDGLYWLKVTETSFGCSFADSVIIQFRTLPNFNLGSDSSLCERDTLTLDASVSGAGSYAWNTGENQPVLKVYQTGIYWADVEKDGCVYRDSITVNFKPLPAVSLGNDSTLCEGENYLLNARNPGSDYLWQDGATNQTLVVTQPGAFHVSVSSNGCSTADTVLIGYLLRPRFSLGPDKTICTGQELILDTRISNNVTWLWQDGSTTPRLTINDIGLYYVDVSNRCGSNRDSILVVKGICDLYVPSAFTPNNDGKNDIFKALGDPMLKEFRLTVFNSWGEIVFDTKDKSKGWNGRSKGMDAPAGVYIWMIRYQGASDQAVQLIRGTTTLIR